MRTPGGPIRFDEANGGSPFGARLVRAGRAEVAREGSETRVLLAVGSVMAAGAGQKGGTWSTLGGWAPIYAAIGVAGLFALLGASRLRPSPVVASSRARMAQTAPGAMVDMGPLPLPLPSAAPPQPLVTASPMPGQDLSRPRAAWLASRPASEVPAPRRHSADEELAFVRRAKLAIGAHDPIAALATLDAYGRACRPGIYTEEAWVIRVEALLLRGDSAGAGREASAFLRAHPASPYVHRVRGLVFGSLGQP